MHYVSHNRRIMMYKKYIVFPYNQLLYKKIFKAIIFHSIYIILAIIALIKNLSDVDVVVFLCMLPLGFIWLKYTTYGTVETLSSYDYKGWRPHCKLNEFSPITTYGSVCEHAGLIKSVVIGVCIIISPVVVKITFHIITVPLSLFLILCSFCMIIRYIWICIVLKKSSVSIKTTGIELPVVLIKKNILRITWDSITSLELIGSQDRLEKQYDAKHLTFLDCIDFIQGIIITYKTEKIGPWLKTKSVTKRIVITETVCNSYHIWLLYLSSNYYVRQQHIPYLLLTVKKVHLRLSYKKSAVYLFWHDEVPDYYTDMATLLYNQSRIMFTSCRNDTRTK